MPVPTYDQFIEPILRFLAAHPEGATAGEAHEEAAQALSLTEFQRQETIASGQATYKNRSGWAHDRLKRAGYSSSAKRGYWQLTGTGRVFAGQPGPFERRTGRASSCELHEREVEDSTGCGLVG